MAKVCVINVVGLTPELARRAPRILTVGNPLAWKPPVPAVTCTAQATMLTGLPPSKHGIVGNGWLHRDTGEVRFWQQAYSLISGESVTAGVKAASIGWWFPLGAPLSWYVTPRPHYGADGSKVFAILDETGCALGEKLGPFPFHAFWGPMAGLLSSEWLAKAAALVMREKRPDLTLVYLPHLDYDYQRYGPGDEKPLREVDACAGRVMEAAHDIGAKVVVVSEYGLVPVSNPVLLNRAFREKGWLAVRDGPFGEMLLPYQSRAFAVCDHQVAHVYVRGLPLDEVKRFVAGVSGVARVCAPAELELDHPRSGDLIALAKPDAWFCYYYWRDDARAPDFARTVDIHRKPGYDPCELFMTSKARAGIRLLQKSLGFRYLMDVVPLDPTLVRGSHGLLARSAEGPVIIAESPPAAMTGFPDYLRYLLAH
ncbi:MAG: alkaline phosphatase family protein [Planctomycetota bacterium]